MTSPRIRISHVPAASGEIDSNPVLSASIPAISAIAASQGDEVLAQRPAPIPARALERSILARPAPSAETAPLLRALNFLNEGELGEARSILETLPDEEISPLLLEALHQYESESRQAQILYLWRGGVVAYVEHYRERGGAEPERVQRELLQALESAEQSTLSGETVSIEAALRRMENSSVQAFVRDSRQAACLSEFSRPGLSDRDFAQAILGAARRFAASGDYIAAIHLARFLRDDPRVGREARAMIEELPTDGAIDGALASLRNMTIVFADSDRAALESGLLSIALFGAARAVGVLAESAFAASSAARGAAAISPLALNVGRWAVRSGSEAAVFSAGGMLTRALLDGSTRELTLGNFARQFGAMLLTFGLLRIGGRGWVSRVGSLTAASYLNEGLGLEESSGVSLGGRIFGNVVMDAQMTVAGGMVEGLSGGRLSRIERESGSRYGALLEGALLLQNRPSFGQRARRFAIQVALQSALLMIGAAGGGGGNWTYRAAGTREARRIEIRDRIRDAQGDLRDRARAIAHYVEYLREDPSDQAQLQQAILELLDLAVDPRAPQAPAEYANSPEDASRILRTLALEAVSQLLPENLDPAFRLACSLRLEQFLRAARPHLQFELVPAPAGWPASDPRYISPELSRNLENGPVGEFPADGALDINLPLRELALNLQERLHATPATPASQETRMRTLGRLAPRFQMLEAWQQQMFEHPALRRLYQFFGLGLAAVGLRAYLELDLPLLADIAGSTSIALLGAALVDAPHLIQRFLVRPRMERHARWTQYLSENSERIQLQLEMGRERPFAALAPTGEIPPTRVEVAPESDEENEEAEWEAEIEEAIRRAENEAED